MLWPTLARQPIARTAVGDCQSIRRRNRIVVKIDVAIRLGPEANAAADGRRPFVLKIELAVEITLDLLAGDLDLEIMPGACRGGRVANPFDLRAPAILEFPEHKIIFERVRA